MEYVENIPSRNKARLRGQGLAQVEERLAACSSDEGVCEAGAGT